MAPSYHLVALQVVLVTMATVQAYYQQSCAGKTLLRSGGLTCQDRQVILDAHNKYRQDVAQGRVSGQPAATKMLELVWDEQLAQIAQRWADQCTLAHDKARHVARFPVGQNIAVTWTTRKVVSPEPDFVTQVNGWFNEVRSYAYYTTGFTKGTGHYSQLVWGDTYLVGCGYAHYYDPARGNTKLYVCNYGPGGNIVGTKPYQVGNPSCASQGMQASSRYRGLCEVSGYPRLGETCSYTSPATSSSAASQPTYFTKTPYATQSTYSTKTPYATQSTYSTKTPYAAQSTYSTKTPYATQSTYSTNSPYATQSTYSTKTPYAFRPIFNTKSPYTAQTSPTQSTSYAYSTSQYRQHYYG